MLGFGEWVDPSVCCIVCDCGIGFICLIIANVSILFLKFMSVFGLFQVLVLYRGEMQAHIFDIIAVK